MLADARSKPDSLIIALDHVTDPGNLGAVARSAEVVGADAVLVAKNRAAAVTPAAYKASAGALAHIALAQETNIARSLARCKEAGYWIAGASEHAEQTAWEAPLEGRIVLVMGSEGEGLARLTRESCDFLVRLPQAGRVGSLNVAQATTALAYEWLRRSDPGHVSAVRVLLVDGYNVIRQTPPYRELAEDDLESARAALVSDVAAYADRSFTDDGRVRRAQQPRVQRPASPGRGRHGGLLAVRHRCRRGDRVAGARCARAGATRPSS